MAQCLKDSKLAVVNSALVSFDNFLRADDRNTLRDFAEYKNLDMSMCSNDWEQEILGCNTLEEVKK